MHACMHAAVIAPTASLISVYILLLPSGVQVAAPPRQRVFQRGPLLQGQQRLPGGVRRVPDVTGIVAAQADFSAYLRRAATAGAIGGFAAYAYADIP